MHVRVLPLYYYISPRWNMWSRTAAWNKHWKKTMGVSLKVPLSASWISLDSHSNSLGLNSSFIKLFLKSCNHIGYVAKSKYQLSNGLLFPFSWNKTKQNKKAKTKIKKGNKDTICFSLYLRWPWIFHVCNPPPPSTVTAFSPSKNHYRIKPCLKPLMML